LKLDADAYTLPVSHGEMTYERLHLFRSSLPWRYEGVVHEHPVCELAGPEQRLAGVRYLFLGGGARSRDPQSYQKDAELLERALRDDPTNARNVFYLAQSYRDAGLLDAAEKAYLRRIELGGWEEECWYSRLQVARIRERRDQSDVPIVGAYLDAYAARPSRAEPVYELARYYRGKQRFESAYLFAKLAASLREPDDGLFVYRAVYAWKALDEWALSAHYTGRYEEAISLGERLLSEGKLPVEDMPRIRQNRELSRARFEPLAGVAEPPLDAARPAPPR
jgi:tetratricopeptide (TPR) repeat protein